MGGTRTSNPVSGAASAVPPLVEEDEGDLINHGGETAGSTILTLFCLLGLVAVAAAYFYFQQ